MSMSGSPVDRRRSSVMTMFCFVLVAIVLLATFKWFGIARRQRQQEDDQQASNVIFYRIYTTPCPFCGPSPTAAHFPSLPIFWCSTFHRYADDAKVLRGMINFSTFSFRLPFPFSRSPALKLVLCPGWWLSLVKSMVPLVCMQAGRQAGRACGSFLLSAALVAISP